jgi:hypothetical protein
VNDRDVNIVIKGLVNMIAPGAGLLWTIHDVVQGRRSPTAAFGSVLFNGFAEMPFDNLEFEWNYEIDHDPDPYLRDVAWEAASTIVDSKLDDIIDTLRFDRTSSGLFTPKAVEFSVEDDILRISNMWKQKKSDDPFVQDIYNLGNKLIELHRLDHKIQGIFGDLENLEPKFANIHFLSCPYCDTLQSTQCPNEKENVKQLTAKELPPFSSSFMIDNYYRSVYICSNPECSKMMQLEWTYYPLLRD